MNLVECPVVPMPGYVVVLPVEAENRSKGGIIIPDGAKEKPTRGTVVAVGAQVPGTASTAMSSIGLDSLPCLPVAPGDMAIYGKYAGSEIDVDGETFVVLSAKDVIAKIGG